MIKKKVSKKIISSVLVLSLIGTSLHCSATNIVPINGGSGNVAVPPASPVTTNVGSKNSAGAFSLQTMKSKIDEVINPKKSKVKLRDNPSGTCGDSCTWSLDTSSGELSISGSGEMANYNFADTPWDSYRDSIKSVTIENGITTIGNSAFSYCSSLISVTIPSSVISIGDEVFNKCSALTSITLPDSVTTIGNSAFSSCSTLTSMNIPDSVTSIGRYAFSGCSALNSINVDINNPNYASIDGILFNKSKTSLLQCPGAKPNVTIPNSVTTIENRAFSYCNSLTSVTIPNSVTSIGDNAFDRCEVLPNITIPNSVVSIGDYAFSDCYRLTSVTIPNSVTYIGDGAFFSCWNLNSVTIPDSVTSIGSGAFSDCVVLSSINVDINNPNYESFDGILFNKGKTSLLQCPATKKNVIIPDSVTSIEDDAFFGCRELTSVTIPNSVTSIRFNAFFGCRELTSVTIPNSVISIGDWAFSGCWNLNSVTIPNSVTSIGNDAFEDCRALNLVEFYGTKDPQHGINVFSSCNKLQEVQVPSTYENSTFCNINVNKSIIIPLSGVCGTNCTWNLDIASGKLNISGSGEMNNYPGGSSPWYSSRNSIKSVTIENGITSIGREAFDRCSALTSVKLGNSITSIGEGAFADCSALEVVTLNNDYTVSNFKSAFPYSQITSIVLGNSVTSIESFAFQDCSALTSVKLGSSITSIGKSVFDRCSALNFINVDNNNKSYESSVDGILFNKGKTSLLQCPVAKTNVTIPNSVTSIGYSAFNGCCSLTSVTIPNSVASIGEQAFYGCSSLEAVTIRDSVKTIGDLAFYNCSSLTSIEIPNSVTSIGHYALSDCSALKSVELGSSVNLLGYGLFVGCSALESINVDNNNQNYASIDGILFNKEKTSLLQCPGAKTNVIIPNNITKLDNNAFYGCTALTNVTIPNSVISIGEQAFYGCSSLEAVTIPESVVSIGKLAFSDCIKLNSVTIRYKNIVMSNGVFKNCSNLSQVYYLGTSDPQSTAPVIPIFDNCTSLKEVIVPIGYGSSLFCDKNVSKSLITGDCGEDVYWMFNNKKLTIYGKGRMNDYEERKSPWYNNMASIYSVTIEDGVQSIGDNAFYGCFQLLSVDIPDSVDFIGDNVFSGCESLKSIIIPDSVKTIGKDVFNGCSSLELINVGSNNSKYASIDGILYTQDESKLIRCPENHTNATITIPNFVTSIGECAFYDCKNLVSVTVGELKGIGDRAFSACENLKKFKYEGINEPACGEDVFASSLLLNNITVKKDYKGEQSFCNRRTDFEIPWYRTPGAIALYTILSLVIAIATFIVTCISIKCKNRSSSDEEDFSPNKKGPSTGKKGPSRDVESGIGDPSMPFGTSSSSVAVMPQADASEKELGAVASSYFKKGQRQVDKASNSSDEAEIQSDKDDEGKPLLPQ